MNTERYIIHRNDGHFSGWPDLVRCRDGRLLCVFTICPNHSVHDFSRIVCCDSSDNGRTWSAPRDITGEARLARDGFYYNNASIRHRRDGRLTLLVDRIGGNDENVDLGQIIMYTSQDDGLTWDGGVETPAEGIVPDRLLETSSGRWIIACHRHNPETRRLEQRLWYSDDLGGVWQGPVIAGRAPGLNLCEASIFETDKRLVCLLRENSWCGKPAFRTMSDDDGLTWSAPEAIPIPCCHRPRAGYLRDGRLFITFRFAQCGSLTTQNLFAGLTIPSSLAQPATASIGVRILPLDHDRAYNGDTGYSGWVELDDGSLYVVNYVKNDAPLAYVHGFIVPREDLIVFNPADGWINPPACPTP